CKVAECRRFVGCRRFDCSKSQAFQVPARGKMRRLVELTARHLQLDLPDRHRGSAAILARVLQTEILAAPTSVVLETDEESTVVDLKLRHATHLLLARQPARMLANESQPCGQRDGHPPSDRSSPC